MCFLFLSVQVLSQEILWQKTFGGVHSEYLYDVKSTPDYGFLLAGSSFSNESGNKSEKGQGDLDYFLWKMDENGGVAGGIIGEEAVRELFNNSYDYNNGTPFIHKR